MYFQQSSTMNGGGNAVGFNDGRRREQNAHRRTSPENIPQRRGGNKSWKQHIMINKSMLKVLMLHPYEVIHQRNIQQAVAVEAAIVNSTEQKK